MKKFVLFVTLFFSMVGVAACGKQVTTETDSEEIRFSTEATEAFTQNTEAKTTISGSFTVDVRSVIPDYCGDSITPTVAVVTQFQSYPFTMEVGEEIGRQLVPGEVYVFTIKPINVNYSKETLEKMELSSLVWELPEFEITDFRLAEESELGLDSLWLTFSENR